MALTAGTRLGPYEILAPIGAGGMGEVYKAKDTRLDRTVAIKVLPEHMAESPERKARFEREAKAISRLNHPHICTLYDVGEQDGIDFIVMEHLEGETLAGRLSKGALPLAQALRHAIAVLDALDKAHRQGLVHRDLKPSNVMLTKSGAKLLDFGLAKYMDAGEASGFSQLPTKDKPLTDEGVVPGTLPYMAPEQLEGKEADSRTDIFAFGAVLYEMLTGRRAFEGKSSASIIAAILERTPPSVSSLQPVAPPTLDRVVSRSLAKDPDDRWQDARDLAFELKSIDEGQEASGGGQTRSLGALNIVTFALAGIVGAGVASAILTSFRHAEGPLRTSIVTPPDLALALGEFPSMAMSPDGMTVAFVALRDGDRHLYLRRLDEFEPQAVRGSEGANGPFFSPDGQWVAFQVGRELMKVPVAGGVPASICTLSDDISLSGEWASDDTIFFTRAWNEGLWQVSASGGTPTVMTKVDLAQGEHAHGWPQVLPGGRILYTVQFSSLTDQAIRVLTEDSSRTLVERAWAGRYVDGRLLYVVDGTLLAVPFDPDTLTLGEEPTVVLDDVLMSHEVEGVAQISFGRDGSLVYVPRGPTASGRSLVEVSRDGRATTLLTTDRALQGPRFSPDANRILFHDFGDLWALVPETEVWARLTVEGTNRWPIWTPDGTRVLFQSSQMGPPPRMFFQSASGVGSAELILDSDSAQWPTAVTPDGRMLVFSELGRATSGDIWTMALDGEYEPRPLMTTAATTWSGGLSPDGRCLVYVSDETGRWEVFVTAFPSGDGKWQISSDGGTEPVWSRNGRELFYRDRDRMMVVPIQTAPTFSHGRPRPLFEGPYLHGYPGLAQYDVRPDGQSFLMIQGGADVHEIRIVRGWTESLTAGRR